MMSACRRAASALASTSLPTEALRASLPAACQRFYHKNVRIVSCLQGCKAGVCLSSASGR